MGRSGAWLAGSLVPAALLVADPRAWSPFGPAKTLAVSVLGVATVAVLVGGAGRLRLHRVASLLWIALLGWLIIAAAFGVDPLHAWLGTPERRLGVAAWLLFFGLFCGGQTLRGRVDGRWITDGMVVAALGTGVWVVLEWWGHPPVRIDVAAERLTGPMGSAALLGAAATLLLPVSLATAADRARGVWWRGAATAGAAGATAALVGSGARAAWSPPSSSPSSAGAR